MRRLFVVPIALAVTIFFQTLSLADDIQLCRTVAEVIIQPTEVLVKTKRGFTKTLCLHPMFTVCCTPAWPLHPQCYIVKRIVENRQVTLPKCQVADIKFAIREIFARATNPIYLLTPELAKAYRVYVDGLNGMNGATEPIPQWVASKLKKLVGRPSIPFDMADIDRARWVVVDTFAEPIQPRGNMNAITHDNLIVFSKENWKDAMDGETCASLSLWAHELVHVHQNRELGRETFLQTWLLQVATNGYQDAPLEKDAYAVQSIVTNQYCDILR